MSDLTLGVCYGLGTGVITSACLSSLGIDLPAFSAGMAGAIIAQTVMHSEGGPPRKILPTLAFMFGSALLATVLAPVLTHYITAGNGPAPAMHTLVAAACGAFAQPIVMLGKRAVLAWDGPALARAIARIFGGGRGV